MIAVDVMGGDHAPQVALQGALAAAKKSVPVLLCGPQEIIHQWLDTHDSSWKTYPIKIVDAPDIVAMDEEPVAAVRKKTNSSLVKAVASVAMGHCTAVISAGNSGALMAAAVFVIGRADGVERPAIAGFVPAHNKQVFVLDLGANTECRPSHLQKFAHMASDYVTQVLLVPNPRVGLLSNGHEEGKGSLLVKETHVLLKNDTLNFIGNVEPYDIFAGKADIVVCDGFSGNVLLKTMEAVAERIAGLLPADMAQRIADSFAYTQHGGALLLGVKKPVIVCHGNSSTGMIENAIMLAWKVSHRNDREAVVSNL
jgi:phosphate acyltransferase